MMAKLVILWRT